MSSENYEYKFYQNFVITWDQFYDSANRKLTQRQFDYVFIEDGMTAVIKQQTFDKKPGDYGFRPFESTLGVGDEIAIITESGNSLPATNGNLNLFFPISLNPPRINPKKIVIKNITSSFTASQGNSFSLSCPNLWKYPIQFLDSVNNTVIYEEYKEGPLNTLQGIVNLQRISGTNPLQTIINNEPTEPYVANPSLNFTIVYEYW